MCITQKNKTKKQMEAGKFPVPETGLKQYEKIALSLLNRFILSAPFAYELKSLYAHVIGVSHINHVVTVYEYPRG